MKTQRFVFLDRDGTLNVERHYLSDPDQLELLPNVAAGLWKLREAGFGLVVVTNQSGIARGYFDESRLAAIHHRLREMLAAEGVALDAIYHCPHGPADACRCRKPAPGMIEQAARDLKFDPAACVMIGDKACDVDLGHAVGAASILVRTGYGSRCAAEYEAAPTSRNGGTSASGAAPHFIANDLLDAADWIIRQSIEAADRFRRHRPAA
jgi:D-glycero-D-manno-heptose 1,7-bisphosphate phosphatase